MQFENNLVLGITKQKCVQSLLKKSLIEKFIFCVVIHQFASNPARGVSEISDGKNLWLWFRLEIRLNAFRRATTPQKQLIIIINSLRATPMINMGY